MGAKLHGIYFIFINYFTGLGQNREACKSYSSYHPKQNISQVCFTFHKI